MQHFFFNEMQKSEEEHGSVTFRMKGGLTYIVTFPSVYLCLFIDVFI